MIDSNVTDVVKEVLKTEKPNRGWVLYVILILVLVATNLTTYWVQEGRNDITLKENMSLKSEVAVLTSNTIRDNNVCNQLIRDAEKNKDLYYLPKIDALQTELNRDRSRWGTQIEALAKKAFKLEKESKSVKTEVKQKLKIN